MSGIGVGVAARAAGEVACSLPLLQLSAQPLERLVRAL